MVAHSQTDPSSDSKVILDAQLRESFGRVVYSHKTHEKEADRLLRWLSIIQLSQIMLAAIATGGFITVAFGTGWWGSLVGAICSTTLLAMNAYTKQYDLSKRAQQHRDAAIEIWVIRENYLSLITDLAIGSDSLAAIQHKRDLVTKELKTIYAKCPSTSRKAYKKAQKALNVREEMTFSVAEVDAFLPHALRREQ